MSIHSLESRLSGPSFTLSNRAARAIWNIAWLLLCRYTPRPMHRWRSFIIRLFGGKIGEGCHIYPMATIWAPWNLTCGKVVAIADGAEIYNPAPVTIGDYSVISQLAYICTASHAYECRDFHLVAREIVIGSRAWIASRAIVLMGSTIGDGCVIGAGSVVTKSMPPWSVCGGNPCKAIKIRNEHNKD